MKLIKRLLQIALTTCVLAGLPLNAQGQGTVVPPVIISQPVNQTASVGGNATFSVTATGTAPLSYQWTKNGVNIIGATNATYSINNAKLTDAGLYGVVVSNASGSEYSSAPLIILPTGSFLGDDTFSNPRNQTLWGVNDIAHSGSALTESGGKLVLTGTANAGNHFEVSAARVWQTGLAPFGADWTAEVEVTVPNAVFTGANQEAKWELLVLNAADPRDLLSLILQSTNSGGQFIRSATEINGVDGPTLNNATGAGETVRLRLTWTANTKEMRLAWFTGSTSNYLGSYNLGTGSPTEFANCTGFVLGLLGGTEGMSPEGKLVADNFTTTQVTPPLIATQPANQTVSAGGNATFSVTATGTAPLSYQWRFNGTPIAGATSATLALSNVQTNQAGSYSVVITNVAGSVTSSVASLTVNQLTPGTVVAWGRNFDGETTVPAGLSNVVAIAAGVYHTVALRQNGTVVAWGRDDFGTTTVPAGLSGVTAIAAGAYHTVALRQDGTVVAWGQNSSGQITVPAGLSGVTAIAAGSSHTVALKSDGTVVAWGYNSDGQTTVPFGLSGVTAIAAGLYHTVALKSDGTVVTWGDNFYGQRTVPAGLSNVVAIAAGSSHTVALKSDGTVVAWGWNFDGQTTVPAGLSGVAAIAASAYHTVALKSDGTVVAWGDNFYGQSTVPAGLSGVTAIAAGSYYTVALVGAGSLNPPLITTQPVNQTASVGGNATFSVTATGTAPLSYQWRFNGTNLIGATNSTLSFTVTDRSFMGAYSVTVANSGGSVTSSTAGLRVMVPQRLQPPQRLSEGQFLLRFGDFDGGLAGAGGLSAFEIYATTNLFNTNSWVRLTNVLNIVNGQVQIEDAGAPGLPRRFYRIIER